MQQRDELAGLRRTGGIAFIVSGALFLAAGILSVAMGPPPSHGPEILAWMAAQKLKLAFLPEVLFFAAGFLVPAVIALYENLARNNRSLAAIGCGMMAAAIPLLFMTLVVHGRLSYPIYGIRVQTPDMAEFTVALYYGGMHAVWLLFAIAAFVLSLAMWRREFGRSVACLGFGAAFFDVINAYPEATGPILEVVSNVFIAAWFASVGFKLRGRAPLAVVS